LSFLLVGSRWFIQTITLGSLVRQCDHALLLSLYRNIGATADTCPIFDGEG
jgi:hypothetical protein